MEMDTRLQRRPLQLLLRYILLIALGLTFIMPFVWIVSTAFKPPSQVYTIPPQWLPRPAILTNFSQGWTILNFTRYTMNTLIITVLATLGILISSSLAAYGFARFKAPESAILFAIVISTMMLPSQVTLIPQYVLYSYLGWLNSFKPLILPSFFGVGAAFFIFLLRQFFRTIPRQLDEAAKIDGCGSLRIFLTIVLPLSQPALVTVVIFSVINNWNDFLNQLIYLNSDAKYTIAVGLSFFNSKYGPQQVNLLMAVAFLTLLPILVLFFAAQKYFVQGIVMTGLKG